MAGKKVGALTSFPEVEEVHLLDHADRVCSSCGGELEVWDGQHEASEEMPGATRLGRRLYFVRDELLRYVEQGRVPHLGGPSGGS